VIASGVRHRLLGAAIAVLAACADSGTSAAGAGADGALPEFRLNGPEGVAGAELVERSVEFDVHDPPVQFHVIVRRNNGRVDTLAMPVSRVRDTSVARVVDGRVQPVDAGRTTAEIDLNYRLRLTAYIGVQERVFADSVWLSPGQVRAWDLRPGWHRITVDANAPPGEPQPLELAADLICVPDARGPKETIICRVRQNTRVLLRHTGVGRQPGRALAVVEITRLPR
jgi:hypothetical protein